MSARIGKGVKGQNLVQAEDAVTCAWFVRFSAATVNAQLSLCIIGSEFT